MNGIARNGERVVIVSVHSGRVNLMTGCVATLDSSGDGPNDGPERVVLGNPSSDAESPDEIRETSFRVDDIHLLNEEEVLRLQDRGTAENWFGTVYQDRVVDSIRRALKRLKPQPSA